MLREAREGYTEVTQELHKIGQVYLFFFFFFFFFSILFLLSSKPYTYQYKKVTNEHV